MSGRALAPGQICRVHVWDVASGSSTTVHVDDGVLLEAPNWTANGDLILNGNGLLWRMPADGSAAPAVIPLEGAPELNNDHVLAPDGQTIYLTGKDGHLYVAPLTGGTANRVTGDTQWRHYLHGVSPDGARLAYVAIDPAAGWGNGTIHTVAVDGTDDRVVTLGVGADDGPEFTPDGEWIYLNTERFSPGRAQIARIRPDGSDLEQLTFDERVNWFPHVSPDGTRAVYISFPPGTQGHPADLPVQLKLVEGEAWSAASVIVELFGGQGTINVNSWSPDGTAFAYVDYPIDAVV